MLAVDNSASMAGRPLREAKRAAAAFLSRQQAGGDAGLVAFGHEALSLTPPRAPQSNVARAQGPRSGLAEGDSPLRRRDPVGRPTEGDDERQPGARPANGWPRSRLAKLAATDDRRRTGGERRHLRDRRGRAHGREAPDGPRFETGGRRFDAADATGLGAAYRSLGRELDRTWQLSYLSAAREGDVMPLSVRAAGRRPRPRSGSPAGDGNGGLVPRSVAGARSPQPPSSAWPPCCSPRRASPAAVAAARLRSPACSSRT